MRLININICENVLNNSFAFKNFVLAFLSYGELLPKYG